MNDGAIERRSAPAAPARESSASRPCSTRPIRQSRLFDVLINLFEARQAIASAPPVSRLGEEDIDHRLAERYPFRILLAEDNAVNQKVALAILKRMGFRADLAANGRQVLAAVAEKTYDVILMDMQMPEMDGLEATRHLRTTWPKEKLRIIAMTANASEQDRRLCLEAGMDDYIAKPIRIQELAWAMMGAVDPDDLEEEAREVLAPSAPAGPVLAPATVAELQSIGILGKVATMFTADTPETLAELSAAIRSGDTVHADRIAHRLQGASGAVGGPGHGGHLHRDPAGRRPEGAPGRRPRRRLHRRLPRSWKGESS